MREVPLTKGYVALVDDEDYAMVMQHKWYASQKGDTVYAERTDWDKVAKRYRHLSMHRLILNPPKGLKVDHKDRNGLNNQRFNLRLCNKAQNCMNARKPDHGLSSKYKGVVLFKRQGTYRAYIKKDQKQYHLGYFGTPEEAALAYNAKAVELFGEYARLNKVAA